MPSLSRKSALIVGLSQSRRVEVSEKLREAGAVVVEAMTVPQAVAALRQIHFEFVFVDFRSAGVGVLGFLDDIRAEDSETRVFVVGPPVDFHVFGKVQSPDLASLGFGNAPDSIGDVLSTGLVEVDGRKNVDGHGLANARLRSTEPNGRQE